MGIEGGCGEGCGCREATGVVAVEESLREQGFEGSGTEDDPFVLGQDEEIVAEQPDGWHPCLKQKTRCVVTFIEDNRVKSFTAYNSCHVNDEGLCPRVTAGAKSGEGYDLCGPPNHAEQEVAKLILQYYPDGAPSRAIANLYGHTYLCADCQHALTAAGIKTFVVTGEPA